MTVPAPLTPPRPLKRIKRPTHTHTALRVHSLTADRNGATLTIVGVWAGRFPSVADAAQFAEGLRP